MCNIQQYRNISTSVSETMSCAVDELDVNPFFFSLQNTYQDVYEQAQEKCYLICIPQTSSLQNVTLNLKFVETHILRPSPYFQGQYLTTHSTCPKTIVHEDRSSSLFTGEGFYCNQSIRIVNEELAYNKNYKPFRILIIEKPLDPAFQPRNSKQNSVDDAEIPVLASYTECQKFLKSHTEFDQILRDLNDQIARFLNNYMILSDYLMDTSDRLQELCTGALEKCLQKKVKMKKDLRFKECLSAALESYVMGQAYPKVFPVICQKCSLGDGLIDKKCHQLNGVTPEQIGVQPEFSCPLPIAVVELANLGCLETPRDKFLCIKSTVDNIIETISLYYSNKEPLHLRQLHDQDIAEPCLTSDDLIPLLVTVISQAKCCHLESDLFYMENFSWYSASRDRDNLSYCLVTFKAAVEFMKRTDFSNLRTISSSVSKELSIEELMAVTRELEAQQDIVEGSVVTRGSEPLNPSLVRMKHQLENVSRMLKESSFEWTSQQQHSKPKSLRSIFSRPDSDNQIRKVSTPEVVPLYPLRGSSQKQNQLGDFLTSLEDNMDLTFGKQT